MTTTISETNQETTETPFKVGDRVRVIDLFMESGREGTIKFLPASNGDDCTVEIDGGLCLSYSFKNLAKIEAELDVDDDEPEVAPTPAFAAGDIVVIEDASGMTSWLGLRFVVARSSVNDYDVYLKNGVIDSRPDGFAGNFFWTLARLRAFDPARDFKVGDIVDAPRYKSKGVVTDLAPTAGGDIEVDWTEGLGSLVAYGPIGATRRHLTVIGVSQPEPEPEVEVEVEPLKAGDRVKVIDARGSHRAVLGALGEVIRVESWGHKLATVRQDDGTVINQYSRRFEVTNEPKPFAVGDRVKVIDARGHSKAELHAFGTVTRLDDELIEVLQDNGVTCHQLAFRFEATDEPKPLVAGQRITTKDEADRLPMGSVIAINGFDISPSIKLAGNLFGRINRYAVRGSGMERDVLRAYDDTKRVHRLIADETNKVVLAFLPGESA
jgi:ribosomal protein S17